MPQSRKLTFSAAALLTLAPLLWAGNGVVGRLARDLAPPMTLNFLRWALAFLILLPFAGHILRRSSPMWAYWRRYAVLGLVSIGVYNALQYMALHTSSPTNVALVGAGLPVWMLLVGALFFKARIRLMQALGALVSIAGVLLVLCRGEAARLLELQLVPGDLMVLGSSISWAFYSWLLTRPGADPQEVRAHWSTFLLAQLTFGVAWSALFAAGEWILTPVHMEWGWPLAGAVLFVAIGPAIIAMRAWGAGVEQAGPATGAFFSNLTPLFAALLSLPILGDTPHWYHLAAFGLIAGGIVLTSRAR